MNPAPVSKTSPLPSTVSISTASSTPDSSAAGERLLSLDFLRGLIMIILVLGETGFFQKLWLAFPNPVTRLFAYESEHSDWRGLRYWDVILPAFMTIAGTAMALSYQKQQSLPGHTWGRSFMKTLKRSGWLLFWGILIYAVRGQHLNFQLSNVLTQLAFTSVIAFLVIAKPVWWQISVSIICLVIPELLFRLIHIPGFDQPFVEFHNFGAYVNQSLGITLVAAHKTNFINFIASGAHTIWGMMAGQLFLSAKSARQKFVSLTGFGLLILVLGFVLDGADITPMLKWISTSSFVLATGGIALIVMALCYEWIDVRSHRKYLSFFMIVGMNSIFIYLFFIFVCDHWLDGYMETLVSGLLNLAGIPVAAGAAFSCLVVFAIEWYLCYFLYRKKIIFKL